MHKVYSAEWCSYCQMAKQLLKETKINFEVIDIDEFPDQRAWLKEQGLRTIPQIFDSDGVLIGGYDNLVEHLNGTT